MTSLLKQKSFNLATLKTLSKDFPEQGGVWMFPFSSVLQEKQAADLIAALDEFLVTWKSHQNPVKAQAQLLYYQLLLVCSHSSLLEVGGCAKDELTRNVKKVLTTLQIQLIPDLDIVYWSNDSEQLSSISRYEVSTSIEKGEFTPRTLVLRREFTTLEEVRNHLWTPAGNCWARSFFNA